MLAMLRYANRITRDKPQIRERAIACYSGLLSLCKVFPGPRIFLNGPGKSGTHLLSDCLTLMPKVMFSGRHFTLEDFASNDDTLTPDFYPPYARPAPLAEERLTRYMGACAKGMFATAHAPHHETLAAILQRFEFRQILLFRDPRDLIVSYVHFVQTDARHHHHDYFVRGFSDNEARINAVIDGVSADDFAQHPRPGIGTLYAGYLPWLKTPNTIMVRYEDLIGSQAGGSDQVQRETVRAVAEFIDRSPSGAALSDIIERMYSKKSLTYRKGTRGDWRNHFTANNIARFKAAAPDLLEQLGFEDSSNW